MDRVLIAGAGIGGLTAALTLARAGADVTVLERAPALNEAGAGLQLSPNATRILDRLGLLEPLAIQATTPTFIRVRNGRSGRLIAAMPVGEAQRRWGAPFLVTLRADLQSALATAVAAEPSVALHRGAVLAGFGTSETSVKVTVRQAEAMRVFEGDALIGADGIRSAVRARLAGPNDAPRETGRTAWRTLIPAEALDDAFAAAETNLWLGAHAHLVHYPLNLGRTVNVVVITRDAGEPSADEWSAPGDAGRIRARLCGWHPIARRLIAAATTWTTWPLFDRAPLPAWHSGRVALLGDAAHPILPFLAQGAAQAIEDAAALAAAFATLDDIPQALALYSRTRAARVARVQRTSRRLGRVYHLRDPEALARDLTMRLIGGRRLLEHYDWLYGV